MQPITSEIVDKTWMEMSEMEVDGALKIINKMKKEQIELLIFLLSAGDDLENDEQRELMVYLGVVIWRIMSAGKKKTPGIPHDLIGAKYDTNIQMLEYLADEPEKDFYKTTEMIIQNYHQPEVLRYVVETLSEDATEDKIVNNDNIGQFFICLKTVIDCFDQVSEN